MTERLAAISTPHSSGYREVSPESVEPLLAELRVVDVREPHELGGELGHIEGAVLAPLGRLTQEAVGWARHAPTLVVCRSGGRSGRAATLLAQLGFTQVFHLTGGMVAWAAAGLPVVR